MNCNCGNKWKIDKWTPVGYEGEVILVCDKCGEQYFNAQEYFTDELINEMEECHIAIPCKALGEV